MRTNEGQKIAGEARTHQVHLRPKGTWPSSGGLLYRCWPCLVSRNVDKAVNRRR